MSGPKSGSYQVVSAAEMRRRAIAAAQDRHARVTAEVEAFRGVLAAAASTYGDLPVSVPATAAGRAREAGDWDQAAAALSSQLAGARRQLEEAVAAARTRTLAAEGARVRAVFAADPDPDPDPAPSHSAGTAARGAAGRESVASAPADEAKLSEILGRLPLGAPPAVVGRCEQLAAAYLGLTSPAEQARVLDGIRFQVQTAQDRQVLIERNCAAVEVLYRELDGLRGDEADTVRGVLKGLDQSAELPGDLPERVAAAKAAAEVERDREFVLAAAAKALGDLGYTVGDDFRTAVPSTGMVLGLPHSGQHGVQIRERNQRLQLNVVRFDTVGDRQADHDAEDAFCHDFDQMKEQMRQDGVDLTMLRADLPGQTPVQVITDVPQSRRPARPVVRPAQAQRERRRQP
jgi:hypothetical protein